MVSCDSPQRFTPNPDVTHFFIREAGDSNRTVESWVFVRYIRAHFGGHFYFFNQPLGKAEFGMRICFGPTWTHAA